MRCEYFPVLLPQGNGVIELLSDTSVTDGNWHTVLAKFNPSYMELTVDGARKTLRPMSGENRHVDLSGLLYFGGVEPSRRERAGKQGVKAAQSDGSNLEGCLRSLTLDGRQIGLPDVKETSGIVADCIWDFPCLNDPANCPSGATCVQVGTDRFKCDCPAGDGRCVEMARTEEPFVDADDAVYLFEYKKVNGILQTLPLYRTL